MRIAFRADASLLIGTGHVMRCLTLADSLRKQGAECFFLTREHYGHINEKVRDRGHVLLSLGSVEQRKYDLFSEDYSHWIGVETQQDIDDTQSKLSDLKADWLVVDHYGLDAEWEASMASYCGRMFVIDDLANRSHLADILLDQNLGKTLADYVGLLPDYSTVLVGPNYALVKPEFAKLRNISLHRRRQGQLKNLLISMGGVDLDDATSSVLDALNTIKLDGGFNVTVILGANSPKKEHILKRIDSSQFKLEVLVNVPSLAPFMCQADLAFGAAGSTSWERCCMGLPTMQLVLAQNQNSIAAALSKAGAARLLTLNSLSEAISTTIAELIENPTLLKSMSKAAAAIVDGLGTQRVTKHLREGFLA